MYAAAGTSRRVLTVEQLESEIARLNARVDELERYTAEKIESLQTEMKAEMKRVELRLEELELKNKKLLLRLEVIERRMQFEAANLNRPAIGFDKIGIA
jgi:predicted  nucleic acid-binding Zn-ribbon protein